VGVLTGAYAVSEEQLAILQQSTKDAQEMFSALGAEDHHSLDKSWEGLLRVLSATGYDDVRMWLQYAWSFSRRPGESYWLRYLSTNTVSEAGARLKNARAEDLLRRIERFGLKDSEGWDGWAEYTVSHVIGFGKFLARVAGRPVVLSTG
jgi:hypothetical protein